jgi:hypothetical protein
MLACFQSPMVIRHRCVLSRGAASRRDLRPGGGKGERVGQIMIARRPAFHLDPPPIQEAQTPLIQGMCCQAPLMQRASRCADGSHFLVLARLVRWHVVGRHLVSVDQPLTQELRCGDRMRPQAVVLACELPVHFLSRRGGEHAQPIRKKTRAQRTVADF